MASVHTGESPTGSPKTTITISAKSTSNLTSALEQPKNTTNGGPVSMTLNTCDKESSASFKSDEQSVIRKRSESRDSSVNDDPKSIDDSISATSGRHNWSSIRDMGDYDPSVGSIKGDSVSATIADYHRKHNRTTTISDNQSRTSGRLDPDHPSLVAKNDNSSVNINYYAVSSSSTTTTGPTTSSRHGSGVYHNNHRHHNQTSKRNREDSKQRRNGHHKRNCRHSTSSRQSLALEQALESYDVPQGSIYQIEPIIIRGNGNLTLFGLSNSFNMEFPQALIGRVSPGEFERTMGQINELLRDQQSMSAKLLLFGSLFCCCSLGFSLVWPSIVLRRRSKCNLEKFLASENQRLYSKLGINWKLGQSRFSRFVEHVLIIEFSPKIDPFMPD
uniref:Cysteine-rich hydrophobic domain 1 protein n=1 Tax=Aceria tosichella TaxID=561515 RepID=A0A6G1SIJ7_9ACAR